MPERPLLVQPRHRAVSLSGEALVMVMVNPLVTVVILVEVMVIVTLSAGACCVQRRMCSERSTACLEGGH